MGFGEEIYKLAILSQKRRDELVNRLFVLPGHKSKLEDFFKIIDSVIDFKFYLFSCTLRPQSIRS